MNTMQIDILNPKASRLLKMLADLKLIAIREEKEDELLSIAGKIREKAKKHPISLEDITNEVEIVRSERHGRSKK